MYTLPSYKLMHTQFPMLPVPTNLYMNAPCPLIGNNFIKLIWSSCTPIIVLCSNYNFCGRYLIIVLVRDIIHISRYSYSFLNESSVLLTSYNYG